MENDVAQKWCVVIIDCDAHYGDGTQNILSQKKLHLDVHHWTNGRDISGKNFEWGRFERQMHGFIETFLKESEPDRRIVFYQAACMLMTRWVPVTTVCTIARCVSGTG